MYQTQSIRLTTRVESFVNQDLLKARICHLLESLLSEMHPLIEYINNINRFPSIMFMNFDSHKGHFSCKHAKHVMPDTVLNSWNLFTSMRNLHKLTRRAKFRCTRRGACTRSQHNRWARQQFDEYGPIGILLMSLFLYPENILTLSSKPYYETWMIFYRSTKAEETRTSTL